MTNAEILNALSKHRDVSKFAKYIRVTPRTLYNLLKNEKPQANQYYNFLMFILNEYKNDNRRAKSTRDSC